jgi:predicted RNase H-like HicB family nuclease
VGRAAYTFRVTFSDEDNEYVGLWSEFPSLSWLAPNRDDACRGVEALVRGVVAEMRARGEALPEPQS